MKGIKVGGKELMDLIAKFSCTITFTGKFLKEKDCSPDEKISDFYNSYISSLGLDPDDSRNGNIICTEGVFLGYFYMVMVGINECYKEKLSECNRDDFLNENQLSFNKLEFKRKNKGEKLADLLYHLRNCISHLRFNYGKGRKLWVFEDRAPMPNNGITFYAECPFSTLDELCKALIKLIIKISSR